jgi:hypothetical protein
MAQSQGVLIATCKEREISSQEQQNERIESLEQEVQTLLCGRGELKSKVEEQSEGLAFAQAEVKSAKRACVMLAGDHESALKRAQRASNNAFDAALEEGIESKAKAQKML